MDRLNGIVFALLNYRSRTYVVRFPLQKRYVFLSGSLFPDDKTNTVKMYATDNYVRYMFLYKTGLRILILDEIQIL